MQEAPDPTFSRFLTLAKQRSIDIRSSPVDMLKMKGVSLFGSSKMASIDVEGLYRVSYSTPLRESQGTEVKEMCQSECLGTDTQSPRATAVRERADPEQTHQNVLAALFATNSSSTFAS